MKPRQILVPIFFISLSGFAAPIYTGGTGAISMGVAPYGGAPNVGGPTYIANNVTGMNDILTSPGLGTLGGYLTASPVIANNTSSTGLVALPASLTQSGGGNGAGNFGTGIAFNGGSFGTFALADAGAGGGSASYIIESAVASYTNVGAVVPIGTTYGSYISIGGAVPLVGNADVVALRVHYTDTDGVFGAGGTDAPQEVLAISRNGAGAGIGNYNIVTIGGANGGNAALFLDNGVSGLFRALAVDSTVLPAAIPIGDVITASWTMTAYADPANFNVIDLSPDLLGLTGPLASLNFVDIAPTPEPGALVLLASGLLALWGYPRGSLARRKAMDQ